MSAATNDSVNAAYDTLLELFPSTIITNVVGVFGTTASGKTSFINEALRIKVFKENTSGCIPVIEEGALKIDDAVAKSSAMALGAEFVLSANSRPVDYGSITPHLRYVKPVTRRMFYQLTSQVTNYPGQANSTSLRQPEGLDNYSLLREMPLDSTVESLPPRDQHLHATAPFSFYDQLLNRPLRNSLALSPVNTKASFTFCPLAMRGLESLHQHCSSYVSDATYVSIARRVGFEHLVPQLFSSPKTQVPTSITVVDSEAVLDSMIELNVGSVLNGGNGLIARQEHKHRLLTTAFFEFTYGEKSTTLKMTTTSSSLDQQSLGSMAAANKSPQKPFWHPKRWLQGTGSNEAPDDSIDSSPTGNSEHAPIVADVAMDNALRPIMVPTLRACKRVFFALPANRLEKEKPVFEWFRRVKCESVSSAAENKDAEVNHEGLSSPSAFDPKIIAQAMSNVIPFLSKLDLYESVHANGRNLASRVAKKSNLELLRGSASNASNKNVMMSNVDTHYPEVPCVLSLDGLRTANSAFEHDRSDKFRENAIKNKKVSRDSNLSSLEPEEAALKVSPSSHDLIISAGALAIGNRQKSDYLNRHVFGRSPTNASPPTLCDVVSSLYLQLLKRRVSSAPPPQTALNSGSVPYFATTEADANEERTVAAIALEHKCRGF